jgi:hypothetical protein
MVFRPAAWTGAASTKPAADTTAAKGTTLRARQRQTDDAKWTSPEIIIGAPLGWIGFHARFLGAAQRLRPMRNSHVPLSSISA